MGPHTATLQKPYKYHRFLHAPPLQTSPLALMIFDLMILREMLGREGSGGKDGRLRRAGSWTELAAGGVSGKVMCCKWKPDT